MMMQVPFVWLSTYEGFGNIDNEDFEGNTAYSEGKFNEAGPKSFFLRDLKQKERFRESGAHFVGVDWMVQGLDHLRRGGVEGNRDPHFCLPGEFPFFLCFYALRVCERERVCACAYACSSTRAYVCAYSCECDSVDDVVSRTGKH